jgi:integrase
MPTKFTTRFVESLKPTETEQTHSDADSSLSIRTLRSGVYYFFRHKRFGKKQIGKVGTMSLAEARDKANSFKSLTRKGISPRQGDNSANPTLNDLYEDYIVSNRFLTLSPDYQKLFQSRCRKYVLKRLGTYRVSELTEHIAKEFWKWVKQNADGKNKENTAVLCNSHLSAILEWANETVPNISIPTNPTRFVKNFKQRERTRILSKSEIGLVISEFQTLHSPFKQFFLCVLLTGIRNGELAKMRWSEIEVEVHSSDLTEMPKEKLCVWNCPAETSKHKRPIRYVLSNKVAELIFSLPRVNAFVFTTGRGLETHITSQGKEAAKIRSKLAFNDPWTLHDLRRTLVTYLSESGVPAAEIDRFIGKQVSEGAASHAAYDFAPRLAEKKRVAEMWYKILGQFTEV